MTLHEAEHIISKVFGVHQYMFQECYRVSILWVNWADITQATLEEAVEDPLYEAFAQFIYQNHYYFPNLEEAVRFKQKIRKMPVYSILNGWVSLQHRIPVLREYRGLAGSREDLYEEDVFYIAAAVEKKFEFTVNPKYEIVKSR